jgi:hypothetical protein
VSSAQFGDHRQSRPRNPPNRRNLKRTSQPPPPLDASVVDEAQAPSGHARKQSGYPERQRPTPSSGAPAPASPASLIDRFAAATADPK